MIEAPVVQAPQSSYSIIALLKVGILIFILFWSALSNALSPPSSRQIILPYTAESSPFISAIAEEAMPIAVSGASDESGPLNITASTDVLGIPMDAYFGFIAPRLLGDTIWIATQDGNIQPITSGIVPWKSNVNKLDEQLFGDIPLDFLPGDSYTFYLLLTAAGSSDPLASNFYLWSATMILTPTIEQVSSLLVEQFPTGVDAPMQLLLALDNGYSLQQIVEALMENRFEGEGVISDDLGGQLTSAFGRFGVIVDEGDSRARESEEHFDRSSIEMKLLELNAETGIDGLRAVINAIVLYGNNKKEEEIPQRRINQLLTAIFFGFVETKGLQNEIKLTLFNGPLGEAGSKELERGSTSGLLRNHPPEPKNQSLFVPHETETAIILEADDQDGDKLTFEISQPPQHGQLKSSSGDIVDYTPDEGFSGADSFTFTASDGFETSREGTVSIEVRSPAPSVKGVWTTSFGVMTFPDISSGPLRAPYTKDEGRIIGTLSGHTLTGIWVEKRGTTKCTTQEDGSFFWGNIKFEFNEAFTTFTGAWEYCKKTPTRGWTGTKQ